jgi:type VI secretion system protein VasD
MTAARAGHRLQLSVVTALAALSVSGCGKAPPAVPPAAPPPLTIAAPPDTKIKAVMKLTASADSNPDANGRPSPVVVRVYQLRTAEAFSSADFFALFDDQDKVLGPELISRNEYVLQPSEEQVIDVAIAGETRFVGAIAGFRDIRNAQWRGLLSTPRKGLTVAVERARIVVAPMPE